jgi:MinD-like ATPase involved in chromosome partitioning or flagellar assembly
MILDKPKSFSKGSLSNPKISASSIAVWGSAGSGKSMLAINLAFELARLNYRVLLVDLDLKRPTIASWLAVTDAGPGITAAMRLAKAARLDEVELQRLCAELKFGGSKLEVLPGLSHPNRWSEVNHADLQTLLSVIAHEFDFVVFDLNDEIAPDPDATSPVSSRQRISKWLFEATDIALALFAADPVGINRFLFDFKALEREVLLVANRVRNKTLGKAFGIHVHELMPIFTPMKIRAEIPMDSGSCEASIFNARPLMLEAPNSKLTLSIRTLAAELVDDLSEGRDKLS